MGKLRGIFKVIRSTVRHLTSNNLKKNDVLGVGDLPMMQYGGNLIRGNKITYATLHYTFTKITAFLRASRVGGSF